MNDFLAKIPTQHWKIGSLVFCMIVSTWLAVVGYTPLYRTPPIVLLVLCAITLLVDWKTLYLGSNKLQIKYHIAFFKRSINLQRIHSLEIIIKDDDCYLLLTLDSCPSYKDSKISNVDFFAFIHPLSVVSIQCYKEQAMRFKSILDGSHISMNIIIKGHKNKI